MSLPRSTAAGGSFQPGASHIVLLVGSGVLAASQIGKAIISMPAIQAEMGFGYAMAGFIMATFATLGAALGIGAGALVGRVGVRSALIGGMFVVSAATLAGAAAPSGAVLLLARVVEGIGFFGVVLSIPTALAQIGDRRRRDMVMALWSAYMPAGIMVFLALGSVLPVLGWRGLWLLDAAVTGVCACLLLAKAPRIGRTPEVLSARRLGADIVQVVGNARCLILAGAFFAYSCQIFSLAFALPLLLTSRHQIPAAGVGLLCSAVLLISAAGHLASGWLVRAAVPTRTLLVAAFSFFAVTALGIYGPAAPALVVAALAALGLGIGGLAPGALYAAAPNVAPSPQTVPVTIGLLQQASNLGQFAGPLLVGICVDNWGWQAAPLVATPIAVAGLVLGMLVSRAPAPGPAASAAPAAGSRPAGRPRPVRPPHGATTAASYE